MLHSCGAPRAFHTRAVYTRPSGATVRVSTTCEYAAPQVTVSEMIEVRTYGYSIYSSIRNSRGCASFAQPKVEAYLYTVYTAVERWSLQRSGPDDCLALACGRGVRVSDYARVAPRHPRPRTGTRHPRPGRGGSAESRAPARRVARGSEAAVGTERVHTHVFTTSSTPYAFELHLTEPFA